MNKELNYIWDYLNFRDNYLTIAKFAEHKGISEDQAIATVDIGRAQNKALTSLKEAYLSMFPHGYIRISRGALGNAVFITVGLIKEQGDCSNGIRNNDHGYGLFCVEFSNDTITIYRQLHALSAKPDNPVYAMKHKSVGYRKIDTNFVNALKLWKRYLSKFKSMVDDAKDKQLILNQDNIKAIYL
jgi:hypothetical protein